MIVATELPEITFDQIGGADGMPMPQLITELLTTIFSQSMDKLVQTQGFDQLAGALGDQAKAQLDDAGKKVDAAIEDAGKQATQKLDDATKQLNQGLGNLLGGKKEPPAEEKKE